MARKSSNSGSPLVPPAVQWLALAGVAVLAIVAVFAFGLGRGSGGGGGHGLVSLVGLF